MGSIICMHIQMSDAEGPCHLPRLNKAAIEMFFKIRAAISLGYLDNLSLQLAYGACPGLSFDMKSALQRITTTRRSELGDSLFGTMERCRYPPISPDNGLAEVDFFLYAIESAKSTDALKDLDDLIVDTSNAILCDEARFILGNALHARHRELSHSCCIGGSNGL